MADTRPEKTWTLIGEAARKKLKEIETHNRRGKSDDKPTKQSKR